MSGSWGRRKCILIRVNILDLFNSTKLLVALSVTCLLLGIFFMRAPQASQLPKKLVLLARTEQVLALVLLTSLCVSPILCFDNDFCYFMSKRWVAFLGIDSEQWTDRYVGTVAPVYFLVWSVIFYVSGFLAISSLRLSPRVRTAIAYSGVVLSLLVWVASHIMFAA